ncbi:MAG: cell division protein FtsA [Ahrensia sp.]|nr:cell division protein FtsA [Ahrensia sp.]
MFAPSRTAIHRKRLAQGRSTVVSVVDIGSTKVCCVIARLTPNMSARELSSRSHSVEILGFGHQRSSGIKSGVVVGMVEAEKALRLAVDRAEHAAGLTVDSLIMSVTSGRLASDTFSSSVLIADREVSQGDIDAAMSAGVDHLNSDERTILHALPIGYSLDGSNGIEDPISMAGRELGVDMHMISADSAPLLNLENCINRSHLFVEAMVASPYASGLSTLVADETRIGCACIDMGGGTTTVSIFLGGHVVHVDAIAVGGRHVTRDIARVFSTSEAEAERIKVLHGTAMPQEASLTDVIHIPPIDADEERVISQISPSQLGHVIRPRIEETLEMVRDRINASGFAAAAGNRIVLTGGASQLAGVADVAQQVLDSNVRLGRPMGVSGLPRTAKGPAFATVAGLLVYPQHAAHEYEHRGGFASGLLAAAGSGSLARMGRWLKQNF